MLAVPAVEAATRRWAPPRAIESTPPKIVTESSTKLGKETKVQFRVGAEITATHGACKNITAMVTVPLECPEQKVTIISEDFSPDVRDVTYRPVPGGEVKQMVIFVPYLADGTTAHAIITAEVTTSVVLPPEKTDELKIPKKISPKLKLYTIASPYIETNHQRIHALSKEIFADVPETATDWQKVEAIYDAVLKKINYKEGPDKGAAEALRDKEADCQGRSAVFIAVCRANKIPARMVWGSAATTPSSIWNAPRATANGTRANQPALGRLAKCRSRAPSFKRATTSVCQIVRSTSATPRTTRSASLRPAAAGRR